MGWRQISTSVDMVTPDTAVFIAPGHAMVAPTHGSVTAEVIAVPQLKEEKDFDAWKGKLAGKIILYGKHPKSIPIPPRCCSIMTRTSWRRFISIRWTATWRSSMSFPDGPKFWEDAFKKINFKEQVAKFFAENMRSALLVHGWGGDGGMFRDDNSEQMGGARLPA